MENKIYLERDKDDKNQFHVKYQASTCTAYGFGIYGDMIYDMFGREIHSQIMEMKLGEQWEVKITMGVAE